MSYDVSCCWAWSVYISIFIINCMLLPEAFRANETNYSDGLNSLTIPTDRRQASWLRTKRSKGVEQGTTWNKSNHSKSLQCILLNFIFLFRPFVDQQERCQDRALTKDCEGWKKAGFCIKHEALLYHCKKTCNLCSSGKAKWRLKHRSHS